MKLNCRANRKLTVMEKWALSAAQGITDGPKGGPTIPSVEEYNRAILTKKYLGTPIEY